MCVGACIKILVRKHFSQYHVMVQKLGLHCLCSRTCSDIIFRLQYIQCFSVRTDEGFAYNILSPIK